MEKLDVDKGIMEVKNQQRLNDFGDPDAETDSQLFQKDREILLGLLPARVWLNVNNVLLDDHCTGDLMNLSNASPFFRDLALSKRVHFLFPEVLKIIGPKLEYAERASEEEKSSILTCRSVCKSWNNSVDHYINASVKPAFFQAPPPQSRDPALINARFKYFGFMAPRKLQQFLNYFDQSHQPDSGAQRNPFIGTTVALCNDVGQDNRFYDKFITLLHKYGKFIRVMTLGVLPPLSDQVQDYLWLKECLELAPNLTHLKVKQRPINPHGHENTEKETYFGEYAYRTVESAEYLRKRVFDEMAGHPEEFQQQILAKLLLLHGLILGMIREGEMEENYDIDEQMGEIVSHNSFQQEVQEGPRRVPNANAHLNDNAYWTLIAGYPLPALKNLECLKLCNLTARLFNPLIQSNQQISWLHIEPLSGPRYLDWWALDFPNLRKLYIKFSRGPEEVRRFRDAHPSFMKLTSLHFEYPSARRYMGWAEIFEILGENWGSSLTELKIRLPKPTGEDDKENVKNACETGRLDLPKLKRLVMWKSGLREDENAIRNFPFLDPIRENLEDFLVV